MFKELEMFCGPTPHSSPVSERSPTPFPKLAIESSFPLTLGSVSRIDRAELTQVLCAQSSDKLERSSNDVAIEMHELARKETTSPISQKWTQTGLARINSAPSLFEAENGRQSAIGISAPGSNVNIRSCAPYALNWEQLHALDWLGLEKAVNNLERKPGEGPGWGVDPNFKFSRIDQRVNGGTCVVDIPDFSKLAGKHFDDNCAVVVSKSIIVQYHPSLCLIGMLTAWALLFALFKFILS